MDEKQLRKEIIKKRMELDSSERLHRSDIIADKLIRTDEYREAKKILVYADASGEVATDRIINKSLLEGKRVYAPVVLNEADMDFYEIFSLDELYPGSFGIREPLTIENLKYSGESNDSDTLMIVPGVAFDRNNNRMGYGRGFYDRYLARVAVNKRVALAYDFQIVDSIIPKETDVPVTGIITDKPE